MCTWSRPGQKKCPWSSGRLSDVRVSYDKVIWQASVHHGFQEARTKSQLSGVVHHATRNTQAQLALSRFVHTWPLDPRREWEGLDGLPQDCISLAASQAREYVVSTVSLHVIKTCFCRSGGLIRLLGTKAPWLCRTSTCQPQDPDVRVVETRLFIGRLLCSYRTKLRPFPPHKTNGCSPSFQGTNFADGKLSRRLQPLLTKRRVNKLHRILETLQGCSLLRSRTARPLPFSGSRRSLQVSASATPLPQWTKDTETVRDVFSFAGPAPEVRG